MTKLNPSAAAGGSQPPARRRRKKLAPSQKYEVFTSVLTSSATQREDRLLTDRGLEPLNLGASVLQFDFLAGLAAPPTPVSTACGATNIGCDCVAHLPYPFFERNKRRRCRREKWSRRLTI